MIIKSVFGAAVQICIHENTANKQGKHEQHISNILTSNASHDVDLWH